MHIELCMTPFFFFEIKMKNYQEIQLLKNEIIKNFHKLESGLSQKTDNDIQFAVYKFEVIKNLTDDLVRRLT